MERVVHGHDNAESPILPNPPQSQALSDPTGTPSGQHTPNNHPGRAQVKTPEPQDPLARPVGQRLDLAERSPSTPGHLAAFDWDEFEARYEQALGEASGNEEQLLLEFERLVGYFNVWASAASTHDNERAAKRLQTRERYVKIAEQSLSQKKQHLTEVVRAFKSALALLAQPS